VVSFFRKSRRRKILDQFRSAKSEEGSSATDSEAGFSFFVNRTSELENLLERAVSQRPGLISLKGPNGIGKSSTLKEFERRSRNSGIMLAPVKAGQGSTTIEVIKSLGSGLVALGMSSPRYSQSLVEYDSARSKLGRSLGESLTQRLTSTSKIGVRPLSPDIQEEYVLVARALLTAESAKLVLNPEVTLTRDLLFDLRAWKPPAVPVLILDSIDDATLDRELLGSLISRIAQVGLVIAAGVRDAADSSNVTDAEVLTLGGLERAEMGKIVAESAARLGLGLPTATMERIRDMSGGVPIAIRWAMELMAATGTSDPDAVAGEVVKRFGDGILVDVPDALRPVLEACSIPRQFNLELLHRLVPNMNLKELGTALARIPLIERSGPVSSLHSQVRQVMSDQLHYEVPLHWMRAHETCLSYYGELAQKGPIFGGDPRTRSSVVEYCYHASQLGMNRGYEAVSAWCVRSLEQSELDLVSSLLTGLIEAWPALSEDYAFDYFRGELSFRRGDWASAGTYLRRASSDHNRGNPFFHNACITMARMQYGQGKFPEAAVLLERCLEDRMANDLRGYSEEQLAKVYRMQGRLENAIDLHRRAVATTLESRSKYAIASSHGSLGTSLILSGDLSAGIDELTESINLARADGFTQFVCTGSRSRAVGRWLSGFHGPACEDATAAITLAESIGDQYNQAFGEYVRAQICTDALGTMDADLSKEWQSAIAVLRAMGAANDEANARIAFANALVDFAEDPVSAEVHLDEARSLLAEGSFAFGVAQERLVRSRLAQSLSDWGRGAALASEAIVIAERMGANLVLAEARVERLLCEDRMDDKDWAHFEAERAEVEKGAIARKYWDVAWRTSVLGAVHQRDCKGEVDRVGSFEMRALDFASRHSQRAILMCYSQLADRLGVAFAAQWANRWLGEGCAGAPGELLEAQVRERLCQLVVPRLGSLIA
jgi:tetratricopeptide (TPR) repeat protein